MDDVIDLDAALCALGYQSFRPGQRESIETLLRKRKLLLVAPTGDGKSLSYQLPASVLPGTTVVVSPLISLMADQVQALSERGVAATYLASTLPSDEAGRRLAGLGRGDFKLVYVAPERLGLPGFRRILGALQVPLLVVDEAHCISEWGHDFRPEYMQIGELLAALPKARVLACTATATPIVRDEILSRLGLSGDTAQVVRGFARPNLALGAREVSGAREAAAAVDGLLERAIGFPEAQGRGAVIIYAPTRKRTEAEAERLAGRGGRVGAYHAGLSPDQRERTQRAFSRGKLDVVVATNAFGMGIDRSDVRGVLHLAPPGSVEAYYQEVGRAGRDGEPAEGLLLTTAQDMPLRRRLIEGGFLDEPAPRPEVVEHKWQLFLELMRWIEGGSCRHDAILRYFGDEAETLDGCGKCDVCRELIEGGDDTVSDPEQVTLIARKALSAVARVHGRYGLNLAAALLAGKSDERLARSRLELTRTFGALSDWPQERIVRLLRRCVTAGWVSFSADERPVLLLTEAGVQAMRGERPLRLLLPSPRRKPSAATARSSSAPAASRPRRELSQQRDARAEALFEALRAHRLEVAQREGVPPFVVASDRTLHDLALLRPRDREQLLGVYGIGQTKADRYGLGLLSVVRAAEAAPDSSASS
ncbi:MAG: RecQ family ATP-dependent DNA helicase [Myxococcales bacterium]|nr:RecQ family ATP-dependent DNA helicase [Myxococcales bacterium]